MIEWLENIDQQLLLKINGWHHPILDVFFWYVSKAWAIIPFYLITFYFLMKDFKVKKSLFMLGFLVVTLAMTDIISTQVFKEGIKRYRPSHNLTLRPKLHLHKKPSGKVYDGGKYGFFSSHASNYAGFFFFLWPFYRINRKYWMLMLALVGILICYSRMYLGVHYPSDIVAGIMFGASVGLVMQLLFKKLQRT